MRVERVENSRNILELQGVGVEQHTQVIAQHLRSNFLGAGFEKLLSKHPKGSWNKGILNIIFPLFSSFSLPGSKSGMSKTPARVS